MTELFALVGYSSVAVVLILVGLLSKRLGEANRTDAGYRGFFAAAWILCVSVGIRLFNHAARFADAEMLAQSIPWILIYDGLPALAVTLGVVLAWRYWGWLLAERG